MNDSGARRRHNSSGAALILRNGAVINYSDEFLSARSLNESFQSKTEFHASSTT